MTNLLIERVLRICCFAVLGVLLVLVLTACGPGSGGTGTGPTSFTNAGSGTNGGASGIPRPAPAPGPLGGCGRVDLRIEEGRVEVVTGCGNFTFAGAWAAGPDAQVVLPGRLANDATGLSMAAVLLLRFSGTPETSSWVLVTVTDEAGQALVGPEVLEQVESLPPREPG